MNELEEKIYVLKRFLRTGNYELLSYPNWPGESKPMKIGRNEQCPCGSGKKYKKCCGK